MYNFHYTYVPIFYSDKIGSDYFTDEIITSYFVRITKIVLTNQDKIMFVEFAILIKSTDLHIFGVYIFKLSW